MFEVLSSRGVLSAALIAPPGPDVLTALAAVDADALDPAGQVDLLIAWDRQLSWMQARLQPLLRAVGDHAWRAAKAEQRRGDPPDIPERSAHLEIAVALRMSETAAANRLDIARDLCGHLSAVRDALSAGDIGYGHALAIVDATRALTPAQAAGVAATVLPRARSQTVGNLRRSLRRRVLAADPAQTRKRCEQATAQRKVDWWPTTDGMAELRLTAPLLQVKAAYEAIHAAAKTAAAGHPYGSPGWQPIDTRRADATIGLLTGATTHTTKVNVDVQVTVDLPTLLGFQDCPGELAGYGPIPAHLARELAADSKWRRLIYEPQTGELLDLGRTRYTPSPALARYVRTRDQHCTFAGCQRPAARCDLDHCHDYGAGGGTDRINLHPLCVFHHHVKHHAGWTLHTHPATGRTHWTGPSGRRYDILPHDFRPDDWHDFTTEPHYAAPPPPDGYITEADLATPADDPELVLIATP